MSNFPPPIDTPDPRLIIDQGDRADYLRNGLADMHVVAILFGVRMELLGRGCAFDFDGYRAFYHDHYNPWAAQHVVRPED